LLFEVWRPERVFGLFFWDSIETTEEKTMEIGGARAGDMAGINRLLGQVLEVHHKGRPDLFKGNTKKYTDEELLAILGDDKKPIFVARDESGEVLGYVFCVFQQHCGNNILTDIKTLYIDDLCVDERCRGHNIGRRLYEYVLDFAGREGCYNVTLNVWECNPGARKFYEKCGLQPQKIGMEKIL
jgi:ribosomal protein S18 acetylase RimI-like enzyme